MKRLFLGIVIIVSAISQCMALDIAVKGRAPTYTIVIAKDAHPAFRSAAKEFADFVEQITGVRLPQTDDASAQFMNAFSSVLIRYTDRGVLATAPWRGAAMGSIRAGDYIENGFALWADSYDTQGDADRAAHKAVPIQCALTLAGSLESVVITVNART